MEKRRVVAVTVLAGMGLLQLWDSRVFTAGTAVIAVALVALSLPIGSLLFTERMDVRIGAVIACAGLLLSAKVLAPHPLPAVALIAVIAMGANWLAAAKRAGPL